MFEFEQFDATQLGPVNHPSLDAETQRRFGPGRIQSYSVMSWGEHCTECAFPTCYTTCSFYQPRQDGRCRRFEFGIYRSASPRSWMPYSAYVKLKNWSQFWAPGNATQLPKSLTKLWHVAWAFVWICCDAVDWVLRKITGYKRLSLVTQAVRRRAIGSIGRLYNHFPKPDCLLIEVFNPMPEEVQLQLRIKGHVKPTQFAWSRRASVGFSSFAIPVEQIEKNIVLSWPFEMALTVAEEEGKTLYICSVTFVRLVPQTGPVAKSLPARKIKCVVWDLDHTLWDGILVEKGAGGMKLKDGIRSVLEELDRRGILLSIASKNAEEDARKLLQELGVWELFLAPQINWQPKSASLRQIAAELNIGPDSLAFVDDMPFERDEVAAVLPMVTMVPAEQALTMLGRPEFAGDASGEGASRRLMYRTELKRKGDMATAGVDYDAFLAGCEIKIRIQRPSAELIPRIYDIVQRTNQLNISTHRYDVEQLRDLLQDPVLDCFIISCSDRYGDYGHVGFIVVERAGREIVFRDCMFSCRVQGKRIDEAVLAYLSNHYLGGGVMQVRARFIPSKRNAPGGEMLARVGFEKLPGADGLLVITPLTPRQEVAFVRIESELATGAQA